MNPESACSKHDKRVLVLLAFGCLFLIANCTTCFFFRPLPSQSLWLEIRSKGERKLYRISKDTSNFMAQLPAEIKPLTDETQWRKNKLISLLEKSTANMLSIQKKSDNTVHIAASSPKLRFLLEQRLPVNTATAEDLTLIPGIGPSLSTSIVNHRQKYGDISGPAALKNIPGIGKKRTALLLPYMSFE